MRRRMMSAPETSQDWDIEWDYTMGLPEDNGFEKTGVGIVPISVGENGVDISVRVGQDYVRYAPIGFETCSEGIFEVEVHFDELPTNNGFRLILSDGEEGCQIYIRADAIGNGTVFYNNGTQQIAVYSTSSFDDWKTIRIERISGKNMVYLNGDKIYESEDVSTNWTSGNRIFFQSAPLEATLKSIKFKKIS